MRPDDTGPVPSNPILSKEQGMKLKRLMAA